MSEITVENFEDPNPVLMTPFTVSNKRCRVYFRKNVLMWKMEAAPFESNTVPISDIIAVSCTDKQIAGRSFSKNSENASLKSSELDDSPNNFHTTLVVRYTKHVGKNKWKIFSVNFQHSDATEVASWFTAIDNALKNENRPKNFLVFVNPFCGKGKGTEIYNNIVKPIFKLAKVKTNVIVTENGNQAREILLSKDIYQYDGIMAVGGDGTVSEVVNALIVRAIRDENQNENEWNLDIPKVKIPVAIIPSGSTDCIAYCLNGTQDRKTAAIFAILGCKHGLDVCSVYSQRGLCRYFLGLLAYGFLGDVLKESEKYRWMGPKRYDYAGFLKALKNQSYYCEVSMVLSPRIPGVGPKCYYGGCEVCSQPVSQIESKSSYQEERLSFIKKDLNLDSNNGRNKEKTVTVQGKFFVIGVANVSCACDRSPNGFSPYSHIGDGSMDVVLMKPQSLLDIGRIVLRSKSKTQTMSDLSFVEIYKAKEMSLRVLDKNMEAMTKTKEPGRCLGSSVWNCDGELVLDSNVRVKNHRQLIQVFTRRRTPCTNTNSTFCWNCYNCSSTAVNLNVLE